MKITNPKFKKGDIVKYLDLPSAIAMIKGRDRGYNYYYLMDELHYDVVCLDGDIENFGESELKLATEEEKPL